MVAWIKRRPSVSGATPLTAYSEYYFSWDDEDQEHQEDV
jgi:hypothetical protein